MCSRIGLWILIAGLGSTISWVNPAMGGKDLYGPVDHTKIESPHPYSAGSPGGALVWSHTISRTGAQEIRVFFSDLRLGAGDFLEVRDASGSLIAVYDEMSPTKLMGTYTGETARLELWADGSDEGYGVTIDFVTFRLASGPVEAAAICGADDRKDISCFKDGMCCDLPPGDGMDDTRYTVGEKVARLTMVKGADSFTCTGFMIDHAGRDDLMMTNSHCIEGATMIMAEFRAEYGPADCALDPAPACDGVPPCASPNHGACDLDDPNYMIFIADSWWGTGERCDAGCDWGLIRFPGNPGAVAGIGKLTLRAEDPADNRTLYIPQHPAGNCKEIDVNTAQASKPPLCCFEHLVDVLGGSSGSPTLFNGGIGVDEVIGVLAAEPVSCPVCVLGPTPGAACAIDADCGAGGDCVANSTVRMTQILPGLAAGVAALDNVFMVDHYMVYFVDPVAAPTPQVNLKDQFGSAIVNLIELDNLANPVVKSPVSGSHQTGPLVREDEHLTWYRFTEIQPIRNIGVINQFGTTQWVLRNGEYLLVPAIKDFETSNGGITLDQHWKCYSADGPDPPDVVNLSDQFGGLMNVAVGAPRHFCTPVQKNVEAPPTFPDIHLACYTIPGANSFGQHNVNDQFFTGIGQNVNVLIPGELCLPSLKVLGAPRVPSIGGTGIGTLIALIILAGVGAWWHARRHIPQSD